MIHDEPPYLDLHCLLTEHLFALLMFALILSTFDSRFIQPDALHDPSMSAIKAKINVVIYKQSSFIAFDETSNYWSAPKRS